MEEKKVVECRKDIISWDEYFMGLAILTAKRSKDPSSQVGACIVGKDRRILSLGYNGSIEGLPDEDMKWGREGNPLDIKYLYMIHAEQNALANYKGNHTDFKDATIYVTLFPCNECTQLLILNKIKEVVYLEDKYADTDGVIAAKWLLDKNNTPYRKYEPSNKVLKLEL